MKTYKIRKGNHYCLHLPKFHDEIEQLDFTVNLDKDCIHIPIDEATSKVFGISFGYHMDDSWRLGWRCLNGQLSLWSYIHNKGVISYTKLVDISPNTDIKLSVTFRRNTDTILIKWGVYYEIVQFDFPKANFGYYLYPYFGGNMLATRDLTFKIQQNETY